MWEIQQYHPAEAEVLACFELKLALVMENYFRGLRERIVGLTERDGTLPVTFWMCERDALLALLAPVYEAGLRLGLELGPSPRAALNSFVNLNAQLQTTIHSLAGELAQEITVTAARRVTEMLNMGLNTRGLPDRLRDELRSGVLSDSRADQYAGDQSERILAAGKLLARPTRSVERLDLFDYAVDRLCV
ncbi:MAG: hypothetical protein K8I30_24365 [Anaerolineae bacterium]|nr:hypothetical protein [Anaerolineae bacterium]